MRAWFVLTLSCAAVSAAIACSSTDETSPSPSPDADSDSGSTVPESDAGVRDAQRDVFVPPTGPRCTDAGWCETPLPDSDLVLRDVVALTTRAFAIAESPRYGIKILEWTDPDANGVGTWKYIDDGSPNDRGLGAYAGGMWAPGESELYFAIAPGCIFHGIRTSLDAPWTWSHQLLQDHSHEGEPTHASHDHGLQQNRWTSPGSVQQSPTIGVWGTSSTDVYAWYSNTIYHLTNDAGTPAWVAEYIASDAESDLEHLFFVAATGSDPTDLWFVGVRDTFPTGRSCPIVVRKSNGEYRRIADGILPAGYKACTPRSGYLFVSPVDGWLTDVHLAGAERLLGIVGTSRIAQISSDGDGGLASKLSQVPASALGKSIYSMDIVSNDLWLSGWGLITRSENFSDGGSYEISSSAVSGAPLDRPLFRVRGTSSTNLWAVGAENALHKTTP
ncbi:hypothetical protein AKJ09_11438 [Labilithrix luteola]|uniref:Uncharacterized protein n=1 Tax=Labilithrix luteola TaxID=1391654 RepID=A0A0K1QH68_9BACT|nr:hypothetical protein [Labilithrix luteola]AKV04775.1 hypothetical protein AKJ09_11438 [Labilithrix luteola]